MGPTDIFTSVLASYGSDGHFYMRFCLIWVRQTFLHVFLPYMGPLDAFLPYMGPTDILTSVFALYGNFGHFNMRFFLIWDLLTIVGCFYSPLCLVDECRSFLKRFVPCRRSSVVFTTVCALYSIVGRY